MSARSPHPWALLLAGTLALTACGSADTPAATTTPTVPSNEVVLITHDSFDVDPEILAAFEAESGLTVTQLSQGDAGAMTNQVVLTKDNPLGDVVFGIDNTFASRALDAGALAPYTSPAAAKGSADYAVQTDGQADDRLTAIDVGDVCVNIDHAWFTAKGLAEPTTYADLADPTYKDLLVAPSPATSSPGLAFLFGTVAEFGEDGWQDYWTKLAANGVKITGGWTDAYTVDFSGSSGKGDRPLVVSYASSPPFEVTDPAATKAPTGALLDTCFRQVEYAGVLTGAKNPEGAAKVIDFLLSEPFQTGLPDKMYVYPVDEAVELPTAWAQFAPKADTPHTLEASVISKNREAWITAWSDLVES